MLLSKPAADGGALPTKGVWIDLLRPDADEIARVEQALGIEIPTIENLREIEASSRLRSDRGTLYLSAPLIARDPDDGFALAPTGFLVNQDFLVTVRFAALDAFDAVHADVEKRRTPPQDVFLRLLEEIVDRAADQIERAAEKLTECSREIFSASSHRRKKLGRDTRRLRELMMEIGGTSERMTRVRHTFLTIGRIAVYVLDRCEPKLETALHDRLESIRKDIASLDEFEESLANRVQLLLDAAAGFISIEQNEVVKVLTVASVAGVPPVLVVGVYGMNFQYMPELHWRLGYPFALVLMALTTLIPILWFKWRDWL